MTAPIPSPPSAPRATEHDLISTLFDLGRQVTAVLALDELLPRIPELIARLITFQALAIYMLDEKRSELKIAYSVGYPRETSENLRLQIGQGLVGAAVAEQRTIVVNDVTEDARYVTAVPDMRAELVVPLLYKSRVIGALNVLCDTPNCFTDSDAAIVRQFGAHVAIALVNARLFDRERRDADAFETLAEIGREMASILDVAELFARMAQLVKRVIDYRTFGIFLLHEGTQLLEAKLAVQYGETTTLPQIPLGEGLVGYAALHKTAVTVPDVSIDSRYIRVVEDVRSELVVPMLFKDRCIGVLDLESPELDAFSKRDIEFLTVLAGQAAVAIENARLYEAVAASETRLEKEVRFAQRVQMALLPSGPPRRLRGVEVAARFAPARELGGDFYDFLSPEANGLVVAVGDVSGKGVPAALYSAFAGELVRGRTFRRKYMPERSSPAGVLASINTILHQRQLEEFYCTLCYAVFDFKRRSVVLSNSGLPYPVRCSAEGCAQIDLPGVPLGSFAGSTYDDLSFALAVDDVWVFCSDGVFEAMDAQGVEFTAARLLPVIERTRAGHANEIVDAIFDAVAEFRRDTPPNDDMTAVALKITA